MENQVTTAPVATVESTVKTISKSALTTMVNEGKKKEEIATFYGLNIAQTTKLLKTASLTIRKFHKPSFTLVD
jgi:hypothetical protein